MDEAGAPPRRWGLGIGIAALLLGVLVGIGAVGWGAYTLVLQAIRAAAPEIEPVIVGEPGAPLPREATECDDPCFGVEHLGEPSTVTTAFERFGTPVGQTSADQYLDSTASDENELGLDYWQSNAFTPDDCLFTASQAPVTVSRSGPDDLGGSIHWLRSFDSRAGTTTAVRAVRLFPSAAAATDHLTALHALISGCSSYAPESDAARPTVVTPLAAIRTPSTVAAVGWVESTDGLGRYYAVDLLRSNAVLRLTVWTNGEVSEQSVRDLAELLARDLAEWPLEVNPGSRAEQPRPGFIPDETSASGPRDDCTGDCFSVAQALSLAPSESVLESLGLRRTGNAGPVADSAGLALRARQAVETSDAQCRFALGIEPVVRGNPTAGSAAETDPIVDLGGYAGDGTSVTVTARVFENPERASAYAAAADYALGLCYEQVVQTVRGSGDVTMRPATLTGYDSIDDPIVTDRETAHIGWQHSGALTDRGHDLQHGNLVVRVVIDGAPLSEAEVAALVLPMIAQLEALEPVT
jgi:hypothetical protein